ncbi:hypothetical protein JCM8097_005464 [Rhodosporidiobolus ruineniae]
MPIKLAQVLARSLVFLACCSLAIANTEILVQRLPLSLDPLPEHLLDTPVIDPPLPVNSQLIGYAQHEGHTELLVLYPLSLRWEPASDWAHWLVSLERRLGLEARTVRLSWAAAYPTDFHLSLHAAPPSSPYPHLPHLLIRSQPAFVAAPSAASEKRYAVPYTLDVEPVHLGGVPQSTLPVVAFLAAVLAVLFLAGVPQRVCDALEGLAAGDELKKLEKSQ